MSFWQNNFHLHKHTSYLKGSDIHRPRPVSLTDRSSPRVEGVTGTLYSSFSSSLVKDTAWSGDVQPGMVPNTVQRSSLTVHVYTHNLPVASKEATQCTMVPYRCTLFVYTTSSYIHPPCMHACTVSIDRNYYNNYSSIQHTVRVSVYVQCH